MSMIHQLLLFILILALIPVAFRLSLWLLVKLRLLPLVLYLLVVKVFFPGWSAVHELLYIGFLAAIIAGTLTAWLAPLIRHLREEHRVKEVLLSELQFAKEQGLSTEDYHFTIKNGVPLLEYNK